uniref:Solute carrier organic anion transporter family member n=1 Tax=Nothobranchius furzeri TaxID=105023 RepID=A0A8C6P2E2_NOTFU
MSCQLSPTSHRLCWCLVCCAQRDLRVNPRDKHSEESVFSSTDSRGVGYKPRGDSGSTRTSYKIIDPLGYFSGAGMSVLLHANSSFNSKQKLLDLQDCLPDGGNCLDSPVDPQTGSPVGSGPRSSNRPGAEDPISPQISTRATLLPGQGMIINGFINTVVTSIERRFNLRSYEAGLIASSYDIAACICLAFVSYFGGTGHKPRWLGWGILIMALGSLVFALPHFTTPPYLVSLSEQLGMCPTNQTSLCKEKDGGGLSSYRFVFMLGQFLHGIGATPLYTLGVTYLDENVSSNYGPVYIGIFYTAAILGPAAGYLLGAQFLHIYTDNQPTTEMTPDNPHWVGAWWIGFLAGGAAALLVAFPILGYPRQLPGSQEHGALRVSEAHQLKDGSHITASDPQFGKTVRDMPRSVLLLLKNPTFLFLCLAGASEAMLIGGMSTFGPKFLEAQFSLSASDAAMWFGYMVVPAGGGGTFLGGYIVKRLNLRCRGIIRFCMACAIVSLMATFIFLINCPNVPMAGVTAPYWSRQIVKQQLDQYKVFYDKPSKLHLGNSSSLDENLTAACNSACSCIRELYNPVCGSDGVMYYSPCHAGCTSVNHTELSMGKQVYSGCSCVGGNVSRGDEGFAVAGKCSSTCHHMPAFLSLLFIIICFTFLGSIPALTATLRCVPDSQRSFGLGIQWIVVRTLGSIPGPIAFGSVIDLSCLLWQDRCGELGSCYIYRNSAMSQYTLIAGIIFKLLGTTFFLVASVLYQPPPESPLSSCESMNHGTEHMGNLPIKDLPEDGVIVNLHTRL